MSNSPQMIDAVQLLLQDPQSYAPLVEHPELAPVMRALRRMVSMESPISDAGLLPSIALQRTSLKGVHSPKDSERLGRF